MARRLDTAREQRALSILEQVLDLDDTEQQQRIDELCHPDADLAAYVVELLAADASAAALLHTQAVAELHRQPVPQRVGSYRLTEPLGEGGMGVVYKARRDDGAFDREVAVKFIGLRFSGGEILRRFENERRIAARLDHPNIARLLDGGTVDGQPYLVMEFVDGKPFQHDPGIPRKVRLNQFLEICTALDYAHGNLVLHRDIKPGNVLITREGTAKLLDFGVAKLLDSLEDNEQTRAGSTPMTPAYTAPECLLGDEATVRSDVFSLGILLCEVLCGKRPYATEGLRLTQLEHARTYDKPDIPVHLPADLRTILSQAVHADPQRRYPSASALAADIDRFLDGRPVSAKRDKVTYVARLFMRRNKFAVTMAFTALFALVTALVGTTYAYLETERLRQHADAQAETAAHAVDFLGNVMVGANPHLGLAPTATIAEAIALAEDRLEEQFNQDPDTHAYLLTQLASVFTGRSEPDKAMHYLRLAREVQRTGVATDNRFLPQNYSIWVDTALRASDFDLAIDIAEEGERALLERDQQNTVHFVEILASRGTAEASKGLREEAIFTFERVLDAYATQTLPGQVSLAHAHNGLANLRGEAGAYEDAEHHFVRALEIMQAENLAESANALQLKMNYAGLLNVTRGIEVSEPMYLETIEHMSRKLGATHQWVLWGVASLGVAYQRSGTPEKTVTLMRPYLAHIEASLPYHNETAAYFRAKLGYAECLAGNFPEGIALLERSLASRRHIHAENHWTIPDAQGAIGLCQTGLKQYPDAERNLTQALTGYESIWGKDHASTQSVQRWLDELYAQWQP